MENAPDMIPSMREVAGAPAVRRQLARSGIAIALVMHEGRVTALLERSEIDEHRIMSHATGTVQASPSVR